MKFPRNAKIFRGQLDAAPFAGVFFLLVIFMLLTSALVFIPGVPIELPETSGPPLPGLSGPFVVVAMDLHGRLYYDNQVMREHDLGARLKAAVAKDKDLSVVVQADRAVNLEAFVRLSKLINDAGARVAFLASRPVKPRASVPSRVP
jgi:biopolymer transport protein ExbD